MRKLILPSTDGFLALRKSAKALLGNKGYDADSLINSLEVRAIKAVIPPKSNRKVKRDCDFALYAERNLVERFFNTIKHYRGIAKRYEKTARNFLAGLHLVCALAWLKRRQAREHKENKCRVRSSCKSRKRSCPEAGSVGTGARHSS
jgi:transposase